MVSSYSNLTLTPRPFRVVVHFSQAGSMDLLEFLPRSPALLSIDLCQ